MNRKIYLLGELGNRFGSEWNVGVDNVVDIFKLINCQTPDFKAFLIQCGEAGLDLSILVGDEIIDDPIELGNTSVEDVYISLIPTGSGKGWGKILLAIIITVFAFVVLGPGGTLATGEAFGASTAAVVSGLQTAAFGIAANLAIGGVTQLLSKTPDADKAEKSGNFFTGPQNSVKQGLPVPLLYGQLLVGGAPISFDLRAGKTPSTSSPIPFYPGDLTVSGGGLVDATSEEVVISNVHNPEGSSGTIIESDLVIREYQ